MRTNYRWLLASVLVVVLDQWSKFWIEARLTVFSVEPLFPHLNLVHLHNTGAAFSMFRDAPKFAFIGLALVVTVGIVSWLRRHPTGETFSAAGLCLIMGGAIGNVIDRLRLGHVTDFIDFYIGNWHFAAFNVADAAISTGAGLLVLDMLVQWRRGNLKELG